MYRRGRAMGMRLGGPFFGPYYGLSIHENRKFIYVRVPKVATHSMASFLAGSISPPPTYHKRAFMPRDLDGWFVFTVVRNPWSRLVGTWKEKSVAATNPTSFYGPWRDRPFSDFVKHLSELDLDVAEDHVRRQTSLLPLDDLSFVARLEEISTDIEVISSELGVTPQALPQLNRSPSSVRGDYREMYDDETIDLVAELYADEIERFRYSFDGPLPR